MVIIGVFALNDKNKRELAKALGMITQLGISMITPILLGLYIGKTIDNKFHKDGIFTIIFIIIGVMAAFFNLFKLIGTNDEKKGK